jgi:intein/homing endonuclease
MYDVSRTVVSTRMKRLGINPRPKYEAHAIRSHKSVNEHFFSEWSDEMAYVLGWVLSDGNLRTTQNTLRIACVDLEVLEKIAEVMSLTNGISRRDEKNGRPIYELNIGRKQIYDDLIKLGVVPGNRTFCQPRIEVPNQYIRHFIRGFFDGDGCIYIHKTTINNVVYEQPNVKIAKASEDLIDWIAEVLQGNLGVYVGKHSKTGPTGNVHYEICISSKEGVERFYRWVYSDVKGRLWLERKYEIFKSLFGEVDGGDAV